MGKLWIRSVHLLEILSSSRVERVWNFPTCSFSPFVNLIYIYIREIRVKDENICFDGYISTSILRIYQRYIDEYFYMNIDISEIKLL